jgi:hypothetical protein
VRRLHLLLCLIPLGTVGAAPISELKLFAGGFQPGMWQARPMDTDSQRRLPNGTSLCLASPDKLIHAGHSSADEQCGHTIIEDSADRATVTYVCKGRGYGRTSIRRDGSGFVIDAQGIDGREPFEMRGEYKRVGSCAGGGR